MLEVVARGAAAGATVARNARAVSEQGALTLVVALREVFPAAWTVQEVLTRTEAVQEVLARVLVVRKAFARAMDWWDVFPAVVATSETIASADQGT